MRTFITACVAAFVVAIGVGIVLDHLNKPVTEAYVSPDSVRL